MDRAECSLKLLHNNYEKSAVYIERGDPRPIFRRPSRHLICELRQANKEVFTKAVEFDGLF